MTKVELIEAVAEDTHFKKKEVAEVLSSILATIEQALVKGEEVRLPGFGIFSVKESAERNGRNPQTGEKITIPASKKPKFSFGKTVKDAVKAS